MNRNLCRKLGMAVFTLCALGLPLQSLAAPTETIIYSFRGGKDGKIPLIGLTRVGKLFYGATSQAGSGGKGAFFSVTEDGTLTVLRSFSGNGDAPPSAPPLYVDGAFYGYGNGYFYKMTPDGQQTILYAFTGENGDAVLPEGVPVELNGTFYGASYEGGTQNAGAIFSVTESGQEQVLHSFDVTDGDQPLTGLTVLSGALYGVASAGGTYSSGTAFSMTPEGVFTLLHNFGSKNDGRGPEGTLLPVNDIFYGTTTDGGSKGNDGNGWGVLYSLTAAGSEAPVGQFGVGGHDAVGDLLLKGKWLYGTCKTGGGSGTLFKLPIPAGGKVKADYKFGQTKGDGNTPSPGLASAGNTFYGTTQFGGKYNYGAIFKITQ